MRITKPVIGHRIPSPLLVAEKAYGCFETFLVWYVGFPAGNRYPRDGCAAANCCYTLEVKKAGFYYHRMMEGVDCIAVYNA
jgi:hypothetical protein